MADDKPKRAERLQLMLTNDEIEFVDHWRFEHKMPSRSAAVRALLRLAFEADESATGAGERGAVGVSSADVGILDTDPRVDRLISPDQEEPPVVIAGTDLLVCHAAKSILADAGFPAAGPISDVNAIRDAAENAIAVVLVAEAGRRGFDELTKAVFSLGVPVLLVAENETVEGLRPEIEGAPVISFLSMPEALPDALRKLLASVSGGSG